MDLRVGQQYPATVTSSNPAVPIPPGTLVATSSDPAVAQTSLPDVNNVIAVRAVGPGPFTVTYSCPGFQPASESGVVTAPPPSLVVSDGPAA